MPLKDKQLRRFIIFKGSIRDYTVVQGSLRDYDERVLDFIANAELEDGTYGVSFYPIGEAKGWDSVAHISITRLR